MQRRRQFLGTSMLALGTLAAGGRQAFADATTITLLHHNDTYEIAPKKGVGGYAPFATLVKQEKARNPLTVVTFGGDLLSPSILSGLTKGAQMVELENAALTDLAVPGNHEFDFGPEITAERIKASRFPWLAANMLGADGEPAAGCADWVIREVGGYKVGFLGLVTPATRELSQPGDAITFAEVEATAASAAAELRQAGAELVVALTHLDLAEDRALAAAVDGIDVVLGGHDHEPITIYENDKLILKAGSDVHYLAAVDLTLVRAEEKGKPVVLWRPQWRFLSTAGITPDAEVQAIVARWNGQLDTELAVEVGTTAVDLDSRRDTVRTREAAIGNLIADAIRLATGADLALINGGGIRGDRTYAAGSLLTRRDILTEMPFGNVTVMTELPGTAVLAALENGFSKLEDKGGRFPQVSGMTVTFDPSRPPGSRVTAVAVAGRPLDPGRTYKLATNDYMLTGGDGYAALTAGRVVIDASGGTLMASTVMNYVTALGGTVSPEVEGRIRRSG